MTLYELQEILGETIKKVRTEGLTEDERKQNTIEADNIARLSKQMINNADIMLRADRLLADGKNINYLKRYCNVRKKVVTIAKGLDCKKLFKI